MRLAFALRTAANPGLNRARARIEAFDEPEIDWQIEVIRVNTSSLSKRAAPTAAFGQMKLTTRSDVSVAPAKKTFIAEADKIADELSRHAIRRGPGAAWIGLDWLGDAEVFQLVCLGARSLQWRFRYRGISCCACSGHGTSVFG